MSTVMKNTKSYAMTPEELDAIESDPSSAADRWLGGMPRAINTDDTVMPRYATAGWGTCVSWRGLIVARIPGRKQEAIARTAAMIATAPRLIRALRDKVASLHAEIVSLRSQRDALNAIFEESSKPPTDAEVRAHHAAGGSWITFEVHGQRDAGDTTSRWWALDATGKPCPRPKVPR